MKSKQELLSEIRYAIRLTERTARLYKRVKEVGIFLSILGGSAAMTSLSDSIPSWITASGGVLLAISGAMLIAVNPAGKENQNNNDTKRYQSLIARSIKMSAEDLEQALEEVRKDDAPEIESLRDVAYNDVVLESNRPDVMIELSPLQRILKALA